ncbi:type II toxin-antitoxin system HicA family toxin [Melioribacteraceae bacterium 4301-Me]|uniref:type II toxin-antitoxin system HicA family toxin n=1 Tax=Pyranulibacter aquaticus TaxID=3163344 RepID=UPI00359981E0
MILQSRAKRKSFKLTRYLKDDIKQSITIPNHKEVEKRTLKAILRQASKYISEVELKSHFFYE